MKLYYTGASNSGEVQDKVSLSLGNYVSSTETPNDTLGATLEEITNLKISRNSKQVFMLALKNTTGATVTDVSIYYDYPDDNKYKLELAFVSPATDSNGDEYYEKISSPQSSPLQATFTEHSGVANIINVGDINNGESLGIWFKATLVAANNTVRTCDQIYEDYTNSVVLETQQDLSFIIQYT